jgi:quinohemoprotein ethanol dehydrogenase
MQANKNGFFYLLDRRTGTSISDVPIVPLNWTAGIDKSGRPITDRDARYSVSGQPVEIMPGPVGAHSWIPMAYNPSTGLMYIPAIQTVSHLLPVVTDPNYSPIGRHVDASFATTSVHQGFLLAWDPVHEKEVWRVTYRGPWNGSVVTTAGNIVAQGDAAGNFNVYRADNGQKLWSIFAQSEIIGGPSTFEIDGEQYIAVLSGWNGAYPLNGGKEAAVSSDLRNISRILVFKLGGTAALPAPNPSVDLITDQPPKPMSKVSIACGDALLDQHCLICQGESVCGCQ